MKRTLQDFGFRASEYERPTQKWVCGWAADGSPCRLGPSAEGRCKLKDHQGREYPKSECVPKREKDRWQCTRAKSYGGVCTDGPLPDGRCAQPVPPCQPVRNLRARRGLLVLWSTAATLTILAMALLWPERRLGFISPGPLSSKHAAIAAGDACLEASCRQCHALAATTVGQWFVHGPTTTNATSQSDLCLHCHDLGDREDAVLPHGTAFSQTAAIDEASPPRLSTGTPYAVSLARALHEGPHMSTGKIACATCHSEHRGPGFDLTSMTDAQCHICHTGAFRSFAEGHPDFAAYPYERPTRIKFDHIKHITYFDKDEKGQDITCNDCHALDQDGQHMMVNDFERSCAGCHMKGIRKSEGVLFLSLPDFNPILDDASTMDDWPETTEGILTGFMQFLLLGDADYPTAQNDLAAWSLIIEEEELSDNPESDLAAIQRLAAAIKSLPEKLRDPTYIKNSLERASRVEHDWIDPSALDGGLGEDILKPIKNWFTYTAPEDNKQSERNWTRVDSDSDEDSYELIYYPTSHTDSFVMVWLDFARSNMQTSCEDAACLSAEVIFDELTGEGLAGDCFKCHSWEQPQHADNPILNWHPALMPSTGRPFTRFSHGSHLSLMADGNGCTSCHTRNPDYDREEFTRAYASLFSEFTSGYPYRFSESTGNFADIRIEKCAGCHVPERAGDGCLRCHNYHVGTVRSVMTRGQTLQMLMGEVDAR